MTIEKQLAAVGCFLLSGCMTLAGTPTAFSSCSVDQVWDTAIVTLGDFQLQTDDKTAGVLETKWVEVASTTRAGVLEREVNKERVRYAVEVKPEGRGAAATVLQLREEWSPMGARSRQWRAIPGHASEEEALAAAITRHLKEKGC
ncbi:MAG: outer membrane protein assembly factor BamC [Nitrospirae bacterium]|nr:MAG: outer membrane protein assembly factor BamC [Nitrospirota bacterium]